jgi:large subunit ribosomal protein L10
MARSLKTMMISTYQADLGDSKNLIVVDLGSMTVEKDREFRRDLREKAGGARVRIIHNRTAMRALAGVYAGREKALEQVLSGPSAVVFGGTGPGSIARVLRDWRKKHKTLKVKGGVADGDVLDSKGVEGLASLPDLPTIRAMLAGAIMAPARGLAVALQGTAAGLTRVVHARAEAKAKEGGESAGPASPEAPASPPAPAAPAP